MPQETLKPHTVPSGLKKSNSPIDYAFQNLFASEEKINKYKLEIELLRRDKFLRTTEIEKITMQKRTEEFNFERIKKEISVLETFYMSGLKVHISALKELNIELHKKN